MKIYLFFFSSFFISFIFRFRQKLVRPSVDEQKNTENRSSSFKAVSFVRSIDASITIEGHCPRLRSLLEKEMLFAIDIERERKREETDPYNLRTIMFKNKYHTFKSFDSIQKNVEKIIKLCT